MIRLLKNLTLDYSFSSPSEMADPKDLVYINYLGSKTFSADSEPLMKYPKLDVLLDAPGGLNDFLETVVLSGRSVTAFVDEIDLNRFYVHFLRGVFPNITLENTHRLLRLTVVDQKHSQTNRSTKVAVNREGKLGLTLPTPMQTRIWFEGAAKQNEFSDTVKENVSIEYLMLNALAVNYDPHDPFVVYFRERLDDLLWDMLTADYTKRRRKLLLGIFKLKENLDIDIDPFADDLESQIAELDAKLGLDGSINEKTAANAQRIHNTIVSINKKNGIVEDFKELIARFFLNDHGITHDEFVELIKTDRRQPWSALFGRNKMLRGTGSLIFSYLHSATADKLSDMRLTNTEESDHASLNR